MPWSPPTASICRSTIIVQRICKKFEMNWALVFPNSSRITKIRWKHSIQILFNMDMSGGQYICLQDIPGTFRAILQTDVSLTLLSPVRFADIFQASSLSYTGLTKPVVPASIRSPPQELNNHEKRSYSLLNSYPELTAGSFLEEALSRAITAVTDTCDLTPSTLFCLGNAVDLESDRAGSRIIPIAAVACGENGYSLAFHRIDDELVNLEREKRYRTRVPSIGSVDPGLWIGSGAPIQQIKFSQPVEEAASWMAARFSNSTVIFRPLYHRGRVPASFAKNASQPPRMPVQNSLLDPNPIVEISSSKTGGHPHADVTFNPWYQKQIGVIDKRGDWSLWNISNKQRRKDGFADRTISGSLPWVDNEGNRSFNDGGRYDGWASIEWIGGVDKLIACDRRCIILYLIESVPIRSLPIELGLRQKSEWILDIKRSPANMSHVFILTTSRVFWLDVSHDLVSLDAGNTTSSLCPQLSWHHFRDADDTTLRLTSLLTSDGMIAVPVTFQTANINI